MVLRRGKMLLLSDEFQEQQFLLLYDDNRIA